MRFINSSVSPNLEKVDFLAALRQIFSLSSLKTGEEIKKVEDWFKSRFSKPYAYSFLSGREAETALLKAIGVGKGDEVIVQAFTCVAVVNPIIWLGATPVFVDISQENYSMNMEDLKKKISPKTKAIIIQQTFGLSAPVRQVRELANKRGIFLIEDCAHVIAPSLALLNSKSDNLGEKEFGSGPGTVGDAALFSFGRDKAVSSVYGGLVIVDNKNVASKIENLQSSAPYPSFFWLYQQLLHPIFTYLVIAAFNQAPLLGKILFFVLKGTGLITLPIGREEKDPQEGKYLIRKYPNSLAKLCSLQLNRIEQFNQNRLRLYRRYKEELGDFRLKLRFPEEETFYIRIPILVEHKENLVKYCRKFSIYLGDWYSKAVTPKDVSLEKVGYIMGSCPVAEKVSREVLNLPCYPKMTESNVRKVARVVKDFYENKS
jgi:dTDP-4-amino-4,6-dideoxygalactose transaminase